MNDGGVLYIVKMIAAVIEYEITIVHLNMMYSLLTNAGGWNQNCLVLVCPVLVTKHWHINNIVQETLNQANISVHQKIINKKKR